MNLKNKQNSINFKPQEILYNLHKIIANNITNQKCLDKITSLIANSMQAEVCSIYIVLKTGELELFSTKGLNKKLIHITKIPKGKGLINHIIKTATHLNLSNAKNHKNFIYLPKIKENQYHGFLGVPILKYGISIGVLIIQNKLTRIYSKKECQFLYTISMLLKEIIFKRKNIHSPSLINRKNKKSKIIAINHEIPINLKGISFSKGIAIGHIVLHEPKIIITNLISNNIKTEHKRLNSAIFTLKNSISDMLKHPDLSRSGEHRDILETYLMFANDRGWKNKMHKALNDGITAEIAVKKVQTTTKTKMLHQSDPYLRERLHDLDDLGNRLLRILTNNQATSSAINLPLNTILVARNIGPAELLDYNKTKLKGLILEEGSINSHAGIVARALSIPAIGRVSDVFNYIEQNDKAIIDTKKSKLYLRPNNTLLNKFIKKQNSLIKTQQKYKKLHSLPAISIDQQPINLMINAGLDADLENFEKSGAAGIGLFRTEEQLMLLSKYPGKNALEANYKKVFNYLGNKKITFRTFDVGGDKILPYIRRTKEENPALGWRAIRISLDRPVLFCHQLRALLLASRGYELNIMFPMIADISEFRLAKQHTLNEIKKLKKKNIGSPKKINLGVMIEVPSLLWQLPLLFKEIDFASIGSNDLFQFTYAADRGHPLLQKRYHSLTTPMLTMLRTIITEAKKANIFLSLCGEIANKPKLTLALLGIGLKNISMNSDSIGCIKMMIRSLNIQSFSKYLNKYLDKNTEGISDLISDYIIKNKIKIDI